MKATTERRLAIREFISWKRHTSIRELMMEFAVSKSTILLDLDALTETTPYYTTTGLNSGIRVMNDWHSSEWYLNREDTRQQLIKYHSRKKHFLFRGSVFFVAIFRQLTLLTARNVQF